MVFYRGGAQLLVEKPGSGKDSQQCQVAGNVALFEAITGGTLAQAAKAFREYSNDSGSLSVSFAGDWESVLGSRVDAQIEQASATATVSVGKTGRIIAFSIDRHRRIC